MPRKPLGDKPMTEAERQRRKRKRELEAIDDLAFALISCMSFIEQDDATEKALADARAALMAVGKWHQV